MKIPKEAVRMALEKAHHYRLLNEPQESESICRDVSAVEPENQEAITTLLPAITDQFDDEFATALQQTHDGRPSPSARAFHCPQATNIIVAQNGTAEQVLLGRSERPLDLGQDLKLLAIGSFKIHREALPRLDGMAGPEAETTIGVILQPGRFCLFA